MKKYIPQLGLLAAVAAFTFACATTEPQSNSSKQPNPPADAKAAIESIKSDELLSHIKTLASDEFEGRAPGTKGEELTVNYLTGQFKKIGLKPGNPDGSYIQKVPLAGFTPQPTMSFKVGGKQMTFDYSTDYIARSLRYAPEAKVENSELVFVGYGVVAPEYGWDDFKGVDVKGKTIVFLINDPAIPDPNDQTKLDDKLFKGKAMTYYGRWTYKFEQGAKHRAAGVLLVHETEAAGYPFSVVQGNTGERFDLVTDDKNMGRSDVEGWLTLDKAKLLFTMAGQDFDSLKARAATRDFNPVPLGVTASVSLHNSLRTIDSRNVVARLEGSDPALEDEYVIYTAHWDHFGVGAPVDGDSIYNGALDNATGTSGLLVMARAFKAMPTPPKRSILFLAVTAEEQGLLGAQYYSVEPLYPLAKTLANINMDGLNTWGPTRDLVVIGLGASELDDYAKSAAGEQQRILKPDAEPEKGFFYRSDHFNFAKQGVPAFYAESGTDYIGQSPTYGLEKRDEYTAHDYHQPSDEIKPGWTMTGAVADLQLLLTVGYRVAEATRFPEWRPGNEFKAIRDRALAK
jgi:Zn-dependent M28 family amino/carboxypeptidase